MKSYIAAIVAAIALLGVAQKSRGCESVQLVAPQAVYAAPVQFAAPYVYQPQVLAVEVAQPHCVQAFVAPQQVVVQQQVVRQKVVRDRVVVRQPRVVRQRVVVRHH